VTHIGIQRWETSSAATDTGEISKKLVILERRRRQTLGRISLVCTRIEGERSLTLQPRCTEYSRDGESTRVPIRRRPRKSRDFHARRVGRRSTRRDCASEPKGREETQRGRPKVHEGDDVCVRMIFLDIWRRDLTSFLVF